MGNCLKRSRSGDVSLLRSAEGGGSLGANEPDEAQVDSPSERRQPLLRRRHVRPPYEMTDQNPSVPIFHPAPHVARPASLLTEEEQITIAKRIGWIQMLPSEVFDGTKKISLECAICMGDFEVGEQLRFLPCCHTYHKDCIDDWLMRSFTCPSCMRSLESCFTDSASLGFAYDTTPCQHAGAVAKTTRPQSGTAPHVADLHPTQSHSAVADVLPCEPPGNADQLIDVEDTSAR